jgi:hypothetical protein
MAEARDELAIGVRLGRLAGNVAMASVMPVALEDVPLQLFTDGAWTEDEQLLVGAHPICDLLDKSPEVLEAVRLAGSLRAATAAVAHGGIVPDVAGGPVVSRHL